MKKTKKKPLIQRDGNILLAAQGHINLSTKTVPDKTKYTRKTKHKNKDY